MKSLSTTVTICLAWVILAVVAPFAARGLHLVDPADLDVDTDRDGAVEDDEDDVGEATWNKNRGAFFSVNLDADGGRTAGGRPLPDAVSFDADGVPVHEDTTLDGGADHHDVTPLVIRPPSAPLPIGVSVFLKVTELEDIQSIHVYKRIAAGESSIWGGLGDRVGGAPEPMEIDITHWIDPGSSMFLGASGEIRFGIEGLFFRNGGSVNPFDGEIDFTLEFRKGGSVLSHDTVRLKVAPFILLPVSQPSTQVWAEDGGNRNARFRRQIHAHPGYVGLDRSGQLQTVSHHSSGSQWFQDHIQTAFFQRPGGPNTMAVLRLPYTDNPAWPMDRLLAADVAAFQLGRDLGATVRSGDFGGNIEVFPGNSAHPLGRVVVGNTISSELLAFLESQQVQSPFEIRTDWLTVGHVDEILAPIGNNKVVIADPALAYSLLDAIPTAQLEQRVLFATSARTEVGVATGAGSSTILTGVDHTGESWKYIRIFQDSGSGAAGQVARISHLGDGYIEVDAIWDTGSTVSRHHPLGVKHADRLAMWSDLPAAGDRYVLVEGVRSWNRNTSYETPALFTVTELLADSTLRALNTVDIQGVIDQIRVQVDTELGATVDFLKVPVIYSGRRAGITTETGHPECFAYVPNLANLQEVNGELYFPRQFGPSNDTGQDMFEAEVKSKLANAVFVDDWFYYHDGGGDVHCGTVTLREPLTDWWNSHP